MLTFGEMEVMKAWSQTNILQYEMIQVLENLEEAIIVKKNDEIKFKNTYADNIIKSIIKMDPKTKNSKSKTILDKKVFYIYEEK